MGKFLMFVLKLFGWRIDEHSPEGVKKAIVAMGPHTSNLDFILGKIAFMSYGVKARFLIKKEAFIPPFGWLLKALGGVPVSRDKHNHFTDQAVKYFEESESMYLVFTPEGTRKYNPNWKKGFYYIAIKAQVPIYIGYLDYKNKTGGFLELFLPTGDIEKDIAYIKEKLSQFQGKYPKQGIRKVEDE
ncbi:MAG: 1-acyl-sn-glycerol-3-phosphate acyltransferase [Brumimicrobium sp.]|nr:1-acyl-sn-glycerol-3-phosphate acyltransferase [Brumimicrobium sp.]MCO5268260.1 1-acyl-sn-glycerol-3-phosphate acyltransferase [Brumimicrobium sp.]